MVKRAHDPCTKKHRRCLLRRRPLLDTQRKRALLVEAERIHTVDDDLAVEDPRQCHQQLAVTLIGHCHDDDVGGGRASRVGLARDPVPELCSRSGGSIRGSRSDHDLLAGDCEAQCKTTTLLPCATENSNDETRHIGEVMGRTGDR